MSRSYCATFFSEPTHPQTEVRYAIYGKEICPKTGNTHWQAYIELMQPKRIAGMKKLYGDNTVHLETRKGTREAARDYCKKDNCYEEYGTWIKGQGHRSDLDSIVQKMKEGTALNDIMLDHPEVYCKYRNGLKDISAELVREQTKEWRTLDVTLLTGPTGCGKTRTATESSPKYYKIEGENLQWFQDYNQEDVLIIDEYNNDVSVTKLLNLLDGYQLRLNVKGGHTYANWTKVFITTNLRVEKLHAQAKPAHRDALFRRITHIVDMWNVTK